MTRAGHSSLAARLLAAQRLRLERTRPSTPGGDVEAERRLYRSIAGSFSAPIGRAAALARRTQVIDAEIARGLGRGTRQVVLVGAGDDGRALRFGGGPTRWFEVDRPQAQAEKRNRLSALGIATAATRYIGLDLGHDDLGPALEAAGHDATAPSVCIAETVFDTLSLEATASHLPRAAGASGDGGGQRAGRHLLGGARGKPDRAGVPIRRRLAASGRRRAPAQRPSPR